LDKDKAEKVADAVMEPKIREQQALEARREKKQAKLLKHRERVRFVAPFVLITAALGAALAHFLDADLFGGIVLGGALGTLIGLLSKHWQKRAGKQ